MPSRKKKTKPDSSAGNDEVTDLTWGIYRRVYSGFTRGRRINELSLEAEAWFWRVNSVCDDFGNADADPVLCCAATAGRRAVTPEQVGKWLEEMKRVGLIDYYYVNQDKYLHVVGFCERQPAGRNGKRVRKFPPNPESGSVQTHADSSGGIRGNPDASSAPIPIPISIPITNLKDCARADAAANSPQPPSSEWGKAMDDLEGKIDKGEAEESDPPPTVASAGDPPSAFDYPATATAYRAALKAIDHWSQRKPPIGRAHTTQPELNEHKAIEELVLALKEDAPIPRGNQLVGRHLLIGAAVDVLIKQGKPFRRIKWACGCIKAELASWASEGEPDARGGASSGRPHQEEGIALGELLKRRGGKTVNVLDT